MIKYRHLLPLVGACLLAGACDGRMVSWLRASVDSGQLPDTIWPFVAQTAVGIDMTCHEGKPSGDVAFSQMTPPIRSELTCEWVHKRRKMRVDAAISDREMLVFAFWDTTEIWPHSTEGSALVLEIERRIREAAPTVRLETCQDDCKTPY